MGVPGGSLVKNLSANTGDSVLISGSAGDRNPPQYSYLEKAWQATAQGVAKSQTQLSNEHNTTCITTIAVAKIELLSRVIINLFMTSNSRAREKQLFLGTLHGTTAGGQPHPSLVPPLES